MYSKTEDAVAKSYKETYGIINNIYFLQVGHQNGRIEKYAFFL
jgi:hypothetical protein